MARRLFQSFRRFGSEAFIGASLLGVGAPVAVVGVGISSAITYTYYTKRNQWKESLKTDNNSSLINNKTQHPYIANQFNPTFDSILNDIFWKKLIDNALYGHYQDEPVMVDVHDSKLQQWYPIYNTINFLKKTYSDMMIIGGNFALVLDHLFPLHGFFNDGKRTVNIIVGVANPSLNDTEIMEIEKAKIRELLDRELAIDITIGNTNNQTFMEGDTPNKDIIGTLNFKDCGYFFQILVARKTPEDLSKWYGQHNDLPVHIEFKDPDQEIACITQKDRLKYALAKYKILTEIRGDSDRISKYRTCGFTIGPNIFD